ncbi:MAG: class I SAM-dependent methyltransferase [Armatimonadetes bacterium]|nr:class I SAM-dependent methyltransferase [Armatimonadota bacterium]
MKAVLKFILKVLPTHTRLSLLQHVRWLRLRREARPYLGEGSECACCGQHWREFVPAGDPIRQGEQCLRCGAGSRQRLMSLYLTREIGKLPRVRLLHFAPEISLTRRIVALPGVDYLSIDISPDVALRQGDITDLPLGDDEFDAVICSHVLEHVLDDAKAMCEMFRVMKPGGTAYVMVPRDMDLEKTYEDETIVTPEARYRAFGQDDHVRMYGRDFVDRLQAAGFSVRELSTSDIADPANCSKFGLVEDTIFVCTKPES